MLMHHEGGTASACACCRCWLLAQRQRGFMPADKLQQTSSYGSQSLTPASPFMSEEVVFTALMFALTTAKPYLSPPAAPPSVLLNLLQARFLGIPRPGESRLKTSQRARTLRQALLNLPLHPSFGRFQPGEILTGQASHHGDHDELSSACTGGRLGGLRHILASETHEETQLCVCVKSKEVHAKHMHHHINHPSVSHRSHPHPPNSCKAAVSENTGRRRPSRDTANSHEQLP